MSNKEQNYIIVTERFTHRLTDEVNEKIDQGYSPVGRPYYDKNTLPQTISQAMVKTYNLMS